MTLIKSISGIRGTIGGEQGDNLTPIDIVKFTTAYARFMSEKNNGKRLTIVVGRDARISGEMVNDIIEGTLMGCGVDVINVGLCTTPGTEMAVITHKADGGIRQLPQTYRSGKARACKYGLDRYNQGSSAHIGRLRKSPERAP